MAGIRVTMASIPGGGTSPEVYDDASTFASPTAAVAGIGTGFLILAAPQNPEGKALETSIALSTAFIKSIVQR